MHLLSRFLTKEVGNVMYLHVYITINYFLVYDLNKYFADVIQLN